jgi:CDP-paratose 2-epimerase
MHVFITGGAGFVGCNVAASYLRDGHDVTVFDSLRRPGSELNLAWLSGIEGGHLTFVRGDVRCPDEIRAALRQDVRVVYHFAAQTAVTTSLVDPRADFETNALGTLNVLEAARALKNPPILLFTSTNKVYGHMENVGIVEDDTRYSYAQPDLAQYGVNELQPLDFYSPYGCSKGAADQYVRDYQRIYGLRTIVFRMSCIYGPRQFGNEDQGWLAHFVFAALRGEPITIFGDGKQVRDILFVEDLVRAMRAATSRGDDLAGRTYNIGGGPGNTISVWKELQPRLSRIVGDRVEADLGPWRPGDQQLYVSDIRRACRDFDWSPAVGVDEGLRRLVAWASEQPRGLGGALLQAQRIAEQTTRDAAFAGSRA